MRTQLLAFLALALLVAALAIGNPFLSASRPLRGTPATVPPAPAVPIVRAQPASLPATPTNLATSPPVSFAGFGVDEPAPLSGRRAAGSAELPRLVDGVPDPSAVERELRGADGAVLWRLRDGRVVRLTADRAGLELVDAQALPRFEVGSGRLR
jgi:hypothetical protein